ncbi:MAG: aminotransferase V, partial [bacterium]
LRSMAGLALVFHDRHLPPPMCALPRYLDLRLYLAPGVPFTLSSNLLAVLSVAVETLNPGTRYSEVRETAGWLCGLLWEAGLRPLAAEAERFPGALTIPLPPHVNSCELGDALQREGWLLSYQSNYLIERNWIQICLFGHTVRADLEPLPRILAAKINAEAR